MTVRSGHGVQSGAGQLGDGTTVDKLTPLQVSGLSSVIALPLVIGHTLALKSNGPYGRGEII